MQFVYYSTGWKIKYFIYLFIFILRYSVTYLQVNQLVEFPADPALSIRISRPSHTMARMYQFSFKISSQLSYRSEIFAHFPLPPLNPKYTKLKNVVRPCATSTDLLRATQLLYDIIYMAVTEKKNDNNKGKKNPEYTFVQGQPSYVTTFKSADLCLNHNIYTEHICFSLLSDFLNKKLLKKNNTEYEIKNARKK